jgi:hypothetical protein
LPGCKGPMLNCPVASVNISRCAAPKFWASVIFA